MFVAGMTVFSCKDKYDLDSSQPSGLNSIYGYLQEQGNFTNYLHLIDDLGQSEILSKTGSKTMFAADDAAFEQFFKEGNNPWNVKSYGELTLAQKKLLLYTSMIDNPCTSTMLSTATGPVKGEVCRRISSLTIQDSVPVFDGLSEELPDNKYFDELRGRESIVLYCDASAASPMVHFTNRFLATNMMQPTDVDFIYNRRETGAAPFTGNDVFVNESRVTEADIFCKNGFIHKVDKVITPLSNMAEIIRQNPKTQIYSSILERFAAPFYSSSLTDQYNVNNGTNVDSVYEKRYFSKASKGSTETAGLQLDKDMHGNVFSTTTLLKFDPGWNGYFPQAKSKGGNALLEDMGMMIVPSDQALEEYFSTGNGAIIKEGYNTIADIPTDMLYPLVNVNMQPSFVSTVPSKFDDVLDDANERLGLSEDQIDHVAIGCNGVVYFTKKVYEPKSYASVLFPILASQEHKILRKAIEEVSYDAYLNSTSANYTFLFPSPDALLTYIDPVSYATATPKMWEFVWDNGSSNFYANIYNCRQEGNTWVKDGDMRVATVGLDEGTGKAYGVGTTKIENGTMKHVYEGNSDYLENRFLDILDNIICVERYQPGKQYYRTKGNSFVRITNNGTEAYGSGQETWNAPIRVEKDEGNPQNGKALRVNGIVMGTPLSVCGQLDAHKDQFSEFYQLIQDAGAVQLTNTSDNWSAADRAHGNLLNIKEYGKVGAEKRPTGIPDATKTTTTYFTNNFHYTLYAPTNEAMKKAYADGLPTHQDYIDAQMWDRDQNEIRAAEAAAKGETSYEPSVRADTIREILLDFFKYHFHDNSVFVDEGFPTAAYTSAKTKFIPSYSAVEGGNYEVVDDWHIYYNGVIYETQSNIHGIDPLETTVAYNTGKYSPGRPYEITVESSASGMSITDARGVRHEVVSDPAYRNIMARELWITGTDVTKAAESLMINNASSVVVHGITTPLYYDTPEVMFHYTYKELAEKQRK